jgi:SAM-dependent methyltransferase
MKRVLDPCCGSRMFWFDKNNPDVEFCDNRTLHTTLCDGRSLDIEPDTIADFTSLPFEDNSFWHIVFDPPHLITLGADSWMAKKYGRLDENWEKVIHDGFAECMRVLKPNGTLIFKWNETDIPVSKVIKAIDYKPLYGHKSGKQQKTHWFAFIK